GGQRYLSEAPRRVCAKINVCPRQHRMKYVVVVNGNGAHMVPLTECLDKVFEDEHIRNVTVTGCGRLISVNWDGVDEQFCPDVDYDDLVQACDDFALHFSEVTADLVVRGYLRLLRPANYH